VGTRKLYVLILKNNNMEFKSHAFKVLSNSHSMEIMINETFEEVSYRYSDDPSEVSTTSITYDQDGDPFFLEYRGPYDPNVHYLSEFMKTTI
jgi:hypothetical protein